MLFRMQFWIPELNITDNQNNRIYVIYPLEIEKQKHTSLDIMMAHYRPKENIQK